jgi:hypothetical protein
VGPAKAKTSGPKTIKSGQAGNSSAASGEQTASHAPDAGEVGDGGWEVLSVSASPDPSCDNKLSHVDESKPADATNPLVQADREAEADTAKVEEVEASKNDEPSAAELDETLEMEDVEESTEQPPEGQTVLASRLCFMSQPVSSGVFIFALRIDRRHEHGFLVDVYCVAAELLNIS